jgi:hypothetical protein
MLVVVLVFLRLTLLKFTPFVQWLRVRVIVMVSSAIFNNISVISWWLVLLVEETRVSGENHRPAVSQWETLSHNVEYISP